jgi:pimeloyl-ACP methyl ester carboxylesterase
MSTSTPRTQPTSRTQPSRRNLLTAAATAPVLVPAVMAGTLAPARAQGATSATPTTPRPTVVLVHGAFADASGWSAVVRLLQADGYPVIAPADPLRGLTADADHIRSVVATLPGPVILVGHSYGGAVITNAARGAANVVALVYIAAFVPDEGTSVATSYDPQAHPGSLLTPDALVVRPTANPVAPGGQDADLYIRPDLFREIFAADQDRDTAAVMAATQRPLSAFAFTEPSGAPAWAHVPSWALVTLADRAISPGGQRFMASRAGAQVSTIRSAHDVMVSHPKAVVSVVRDAAAGAR